MDPLDRLFRRLVEALHAVHGDALDRSLTVAEIYQHLIPYRSVRSDVGFAELAAYEHALLRLLAGEREYVQVELPHVQEEFRRELRSPNPILGLYRDYAAVDVRVVAGAPPREPASPDGASPPAARAVVAAPGAAGGDMGGERPGVPGTSGGATPSSAASPTRFAPDQAAEPRAAEPAPAPAATSDPLPMLSRTPPPAPHPEICWSCQSSLPHGREVSFCPYCGKGQREAPCGACGEPVEPQWRFCVRCGASQVVADEAV